MKIDHTTHKASHTMITEGVFRECRNMLIREDCEYTFIRTLFIKGDYYDLLLEDRSKIFPKEPLQQYSVLLAKRM